MILSVTRLQMFALLDQTLEGCNGIVKVAEVVIHDFPFFGCHLDDGDMDTLPRVSDKFDSFDVGTDR